MKQLRLVWRRLIPIVSILIGIGFLILGTKNEIWFHTGSGRADVVTRCWMVVVRSERYGIDIAGEIERLGLATNDTNIVVFRTSTNYYFVKTHPYSRAGSLFSALAHFTENNRSLSADESHVMEFSSVLTKLRKEEASSVEHMLNRP